jgi:hypothetical protein
VLLDRVARAAKLIIEPIIVELIESRVAATVRREVKTHGLQRFDFRPRQERCPWNFRGLPAPVVVLPHAVGDQEYGRGASEAKENVGDLKDRSIPIIKRQRVTTLDRRPTRRDPLAEINGAKAGIAQRRKRVGELSGIGRDDASRRVERVIGQDGQPLGAHP